MPTLQSCRVRLDNEWERDRLWIKQKRFRAAPSQEALRCYMLMGSGSDGSAAAQTWIPLYLLEGETLPAPLNLLLLCHNIHGPYVLILLPCVQYMSQLQAALFSATHRSHHPRKPYVFILEPVFATGVLSIHLIMLQMCPTSESSPRKGTLTLALLQVGSSHYCYALGLSLGSEVPFGRY